MTTINASDKVTIQRVIDIIESSINTGFELEKDELESITQDLKGIISK